MSRNVVILGFTHRSWQNFSRLLPEPTFWQFNEIRYPSSPRNWPARVHPVYRGISLGLSVRTKWKEPDVLSLLARSAEWNRLFRRVWTLPCRLYSRLIVGAGSTVLFWNPVVLRFMPPSWRNFHSSRVSLASRTKMTRGVFAGTRRFGKFVGTRTVSALGTERSA